MLLAIDIGNTETTVGVFDGEKKKAAFQITTSIHRTADEAAVMIISILRNRGLEASDIKEVALCSVVPPLTIIFDDMIKRYFNVSPLIVTVGIKTGIRICMDNPREVGADRVVNAAAAHHLYGGPVIVTDMGTATTFDVVSKEGCYQGGSIAPGINTAAETLFIKAAMLPRVELIHPKHAIGTSTVTAMQSGIVLGYVSLIEGMITRIQQELGEKARVVATGGWSTIIAKETKVFDVVNPDLTLIGIRLIYLMNRS